MVDIHEHTIASLYEHINVLYNILNDTTIGIFCFFLLLCVALFAFIIALSERFYKQKQEIQEIKNEINKLKK